MIPTAVWEYVVARVRDEFPETFFLLEGLGGSLEATISLLHDANLNGAYSEIFQNYDRNSLEHYLPLAQRMAEENGLMMHFAETHDNERLAARSPAHARLRTALAALTSINGAFAFANGVEWLAREKIDVHGRSDLNWGGADNIVDWVRRLQALLRTHPAFFPGADMRQIQRGPGNALAVLRRPAAGADPLLALINLDEDQPVDLSWPAAEFSPPAGRAQDLLSGETVRLLPAAKDHLRLRLAPAQVCCLTGDAAVLQVLADAEEQAGLPPARVDRQLLRHKVMQIYNAFRGFTGLRDRQVNDWTDLLQEDPAACCRRLTPAGVDCVTRWQAPRDCRRLMMVPAGHCLLSIMSHPFRLRLDAAGRVLAQEDSLPMADGSHFVLLPPQAVRREINCDLRAILYAPGKVEKLRGRLLYLPTAERACVPRVAFAPERRERLMYLGVNDRGGMSRAAVAWGELYSRYDALLAANLHPRHPENRRVLFTRCRAWLVYRGYSRELNRVCLNGFQTTDREGVWSFLVPFGAEGHVRLQLHLSMSQDANALHLLFKRLPADRDVRALPDDAPARLVLRPDIEDRDFHEDTLAYAGPEHSWPAAVSAMPDGFVFAPAPERKLCLRLSRGVYHAAPEWQYMVQHPVEAERGLRDHSDLFSPGYFTADLVAADEVRLTADTDRGVTPPPPAGRRRRLLSDALAQALRCYVVRRDELKTVIAGYPWFLDWGRDTLICARGMIAAGMLDEVRQIILQFAAFEERGTLPNMINGDETANRDTSDAPLWLVAVCADWCRAAGDRELLNTPVGRRSLREVLVGILSGYRRGTPNGIRMDRETGLIYSPAHFTWMDTNHPAGTARAGYPVEIQALWWAALDFLGADDARPVWRRLAARVRDNIRALYWDATRGFLSDCRHAASGQSAHEARPDDALRPNQLLVVTLGVLADEEIGRAVLQACEELLVPGGLRSLADRPVQHPLPVFFKGQLLNDPEHPYWPRYEGEEDTHRKPAYHNGTAWGWLFPAFCEAWFRVYGPAGRPAALSWLAGGIRTAIVRGCVGHLPEIMDGDYPHQPRGCDAQAWSCAESFRVLRLLEQNENPATVSR
ncbi:MAG: glycogen debranching enzyme N-terminal domain-containing protein [Lentisphaerae bacterium]|nr:glycogen debranching enzyme N-terminal domain-containing protein [Lentisphaerota bacterium]